jgi:CRISPR-associated protein Csm4
MEWFDVTLKVQSALGTRLSADTLFGHLCWGIRYHQGQQALSDFLARYEHDSSPPLLLSDPFPVDFWQMPALPRPFKKQEDQLLRILQSEEKSRLENTLPGCPAVSRIAGSKPSSVDAFDILKWLYQLRWLPHEVLGSTINQLAVASILNWFLTKGCGQPVMPIEEVVPHNTINRLTGTTGDVGSFFFTRQLCIDPSRPPVFHLLAGSDCYDARQIGDLMTAGLEAGYGKYKSRGKGRVTLESIDPITLPKAQTPNAVLLLAACVPAAEDPADGFWKLTTKFGKLGGDWAVGPHPTGIHNPFKKPLVMLSAGAVLKTDSPRPFYGRLVDQIHPDFPEVRHYGLAPAIPVCCDFTKNV